VAELQHAGALERRYVALADGALKPASGTWNVPVGVGKGGRPAAHGKDARLSRTHFVVAESLAGTRASGTTSLIVLTPETGRSHQLRVHASHAGAPLLGDVAHGGPRRLVRNDGSVVSLPRVFLHAFCIRVVQDGREQWRAVAECPADFVETYVALGGSPESLRIQRLDASP
jgi:23S rRNA pseudouridine955/2504/2580 synthase/23S rRNA pseudouridine1911/1915/1917 synthase